MNKRAFLSEKSFILLMLFAGIAAVAVILQGTGGITGYAVDEFQPQVNLPPIYSGGSLETAADTALVIDLATLFSDPESDPLTFLATQEDQIRVDIVDSIATFTPAAGFVGERTVTIIASDSINLVREPVRLTVTGAAPEETPAPTETVEPTPSETPVENVTITPTPEETPENLTNDTFAAEPVIIIPQDVPAGRAVALNAEVRDEANAKVGTKTADEPGYETYFTFIGTQGPQFLLTFAHNASQTLPVWVEGNVGASLSTNSAAPFENVTLIVPLQLGAIPSFRLHVGAESEIFDFGGFGSQEFSVSDVVDSCNDPVDMNTSTSLTQSLTSNGTCIFINDSNVFLNCSGFAIFYNANGSNGQYGVTVHNAVNVTIQDCLFRDINASGSSVFGINVQNTNASTIINNTVVGNGSSSNIGVRVGSIARFNTVTNNNITVRGTGASNTGLTLNTSAQFNNVTSNVIFVNGSSSNIGVSTAGSSASNRVVNNTIRATGISSNNGVTPGGTNNAFINNTVRADGNGSTNQGFTITAIDGGTIAGNSITTNGTGGGGNEGIEFDTSNNHVNISNNTITTDGSGSFNWGVRLFANSNVTLTENVITALGTNENHGVVFEASPSNHTLISNTITGRGNGSYAVVLFGGAYDHVFTNTILVSPTAWVFSEADIRANFSNTSFVTQDGSVRITGTFNLTGDQNITRNRLNISQNRSFVNSTNLTFLNQSARVTLNNITFGSPQIRSDFEDDGTFINCPATICTGRDFTANTLSFDVTRFTSYAAGEGLQNLSGCAIVNQSSVLTQSVTSATTCIVINNNSVTLDCAGFTVNYGTGAADNSMGVNATNFNGTAIANCVIAKGSTSGNKSYGIGLFDSQQATVENNIITTNGTTENDGIHVEGATGVSQTVELITGPGDPTIPGTTLTSNCVAQPNVNSCNVCPTAPGVTCSSFVEQSGCPDQTAAISNTHLNFTLPAGNLPSVGFIQIYAGEVVDCRLNGIFVVGHGYARNQCARRAVATIPGTAFVVGENILSCVARGAGKEEDAGIRIYKFSYSLPGQRPSNLSIRNNTVVTSGGNSSHGMFLDLVNSTVANNTVTATGQFFAHGINIGFGGINNTIANNSVRAFANGADGIHVSGAHNAFLNNSIVNATRSGIFLERATNNTFNLSLIALSRSGSSLFIEEVDGSVNFTQQVNITAGAYLGDIVSITLNRTFLNASHPAGGQLNRSAIVSLILNASFFDSVPVFDAADAGAFQACQDPRCRNINFSATSGVLRFNVTSFTTYAASEVSGCGTLDGDPNATTTTFTLVNNVTATGSSCFSMIGDNVTLNCDGFTIYYGTGNTNNVYGVDVKPANGTNSTINETRNVEVRNCVVVQNGTGTNAHGIRVAQGRNITLTNNNVTTRGSGANGIHFQNTINATTAGNTVEYGGASVANTNGVALNFSVNVAINGLNIRQNGTGSNGSAIFVSQSNNTGINGTNASTQGLNSSAILFVNASGIAASNLNASTGGNNSQAISLRDVQNGRFAVTNATTTAIRVPAVAIHNASNISFVTSSLRTDGHFSQGLFATNSIGIGGSGINVTTFGNESAGILLTNASHAAVGIGNVTTYGTNAHGVLLANGTAVNLTGGTITTFGASAHGVHLNEFGNATLRSLHIAPDDDALRVDGQFLPHWNSHDIDTSNTGIGGGTIQYYGAAGSSPACPSGTTSAAGFYHLTLVNCGSALLTGFNSPEMVSFIGTNGTSVTGAVVTNNSRGMRVFFANTGTIANSTFSTFRGNNNNIGVHLRNSSGINISGSRVHTDGGTGNFGIFLQNSSSRNNVSLSNISTNGSDANMGLFLTTGSSFNGIHNNVISTRGTGGSNGGIVLNLSAENNTISANTITTNGTNNSHGIEMRTSGNIMNANTIFASGSGGNNMGISVASQGLTTQSFNDGFEDGTLSPFTSTGTNHVWAVNTTVVFAGSFSAKSGDINDSQSTSMSLTRTLAGSGTISFARNVSSESCCDFLRFYIDGSLQQSFGGFLPWAYFNYSVAAGTHTFTWTYDKDSSLSSGLDAGFVDDVNITETVVPEGNNLTSNTISTLGTFNNYGTQYTTGVSGTIADNVIRPRGTSLNNTGILVTSGAAINITRNRIATFGSNNNNGMRLAGMSFSNVINNSIHTDGNESYNRGIVLSGSSNNTLENNNITTNGTRNNNGVDLIATSNGNMVRNTTIVSAHGTAEGNKGIVFNRSAYNKALLNNISVNGSYQNMGMLIEGSNSGDGAAYNNTMDFNVIRTNGNESDNYGVHINWLARDNNVSLNNITTNGTNNNTGIFLKFGPQRNNASNNTIVSSGTGSNNHGVHMFAIQNADIQYNVIERSRINTTGTRQDIGIFLEAPFNGIRIRFNRIYQNTIRSSGAADRNNGIRLLDHVMSNVVEANAINTTGIGNNTGILVENAAFGDGADNNDVFANTIQTGDDGGDNVGIWLRDPNTFSGLSGTNISNNTIMTNGTVNNHGIMYTDGANTNNATANRIVTNGSARNHGIFTNASSGNTFAFTNITTNGSQSFGIVVNSSSSVSFRFMRLNGTTEWMNTTHTTTSTFENITFEEPNGSIQIYPSFTLSGRQEVTKQRLSISFNRAFLNSTNLTSMNRSAIIVLRNITFLDPVPAVDFNDDGESDVCGFPRCVELSFENQVYTFNVTNFSAYSVVGNVNITLTKFDSPDPVGVGEPLTYRIEVNITGNTTAFNVTVNDTYPSEAIFVSASPSPNTGTNNTFSLGNLSNGTSFSINVTVTPRSTLGNGTVLNNSVNVTYQNETGQRPSLVTTALTTVYGPFNVTNISIAKTDAPDPVENGTRLNYTITLTFNGNGTAYNVTVTDTYPADTVFNSAQPSPLTGTNNTFVVGNVSAGSTFVLNLSVNVSQIANGTVINNSANVTFQNETGNRPSRIATASTTVQNVTVDTPPPPPPPPAPSGGGGGGWTTPTVGGVEQPAVIPEQESDGCSESWTCDDWSACVNNRQVRTCTDWGSCNTTLLLPLTEQACVMPPTPEPEEEPLVMPTLQPESEPQLETQRWTLCTLLPIVVDGALIVLAVLVLLYLILTMRQKQDRRMRTAVDIGLVVALLLLIAQYILCKAFLPLEYIIFLLLTVFAVLLRVADYLGQKKVKPVIAPRKPWSQGFRDVEHKLESLKPTLPKFERPSWFALPRFPKAASEPKLKEKESLLKQIDSSLSKALTKPKPVKVPKPAPLPPSKPLKKLFSFAPKPKAPTASLPAPRASTRDLKDILAAVHQSEKLLERYSRTTKRFKKK